MSRVFVGVRIEGDRPWLKDHFSLLRNLSYNKEDLRIVYSVKDTVDKGALKAIKEFKDSSKLNIEVYKEPYSKDLLEYGVEMGSSIFNDWKKMFSEDYFLLLDSDIVEAPPFLINELQRVDQPISAPYIYVRNTNIFYDTFKFRIENRCFHPQYPPGSGLIVPIEISSAGGCMLVKGDVFRDTEIVDPYPTVSLCYNAYKRGYRTVGLPYLRVGHEDLTKYNIRHSPLNYRFGGYPRDNIFYSAFNKVRITPGEPGPLTPGLKNYLEDKKNEMDKKIMEDAETIFKNDPIVAKEKSLQWAYNILKFHNYYFTSDPLKIMIDYYLEPYLEWVEVEVSTFCNLSCPMCERTHWKEPNRNMTLEEFKNIIDQFPDLKQIGLTGIGESLMNKDFIEMQKYVKKDPDVYMEIFDHFHNTTDKVLNEWVDMGLDKIYVSMDAAHEETYAFQRPGSNFEKVLNNIKKLDQIKKDKGVHYPRFCFHYIINKQNLCDVLDYLDLVKDLGVDTWFVQYSRMLHPYPEVKDMFVEVPEKTRNQIFTRAKKLGLEVRFNANTPLVKPPLYQCTAYVQPFIFVTGEVVPCCATNEGNERDYQKEWSMGNVFKTPFKDIWYGNEFRRLRKMLYTGQIHEVCRRCPLFNVRVRS